MDTLLQAACWWLLQFCPFYITGISVHFHSKRTARGRFFVCLFKKSSQPTRAELKRLRDIEETATVKED